MKAAFFSLAAFALGVAAAPNKEAKRNSNSWAGSNNYFLIGLTSAEQDTYISTLASYGAKAVRLWVNAQSAGSCEKGSTTATSIPDLESSIGNYDDTVLDAIDAVLVKFVNYGIKALISPHDAANEFYSGSSDPYWNTYGSGYFYEEQAAFTAYDNRLQHVLEYTGKTSGRVWSNYSEAIMGFDLQNEPMSTKLAECQGSNPAGANWPCGRAAFMRSILGDDNPIRIASGGIGGDISHDCNFMEAAITCSQLDIISIHRYAGSEGDNGGDEWSGAIPGYLSDANGKLVIIEEWGVNQYGGNTDIDTEFPAQADDINRGGVPWIYWQIVPAETCSYNPDDDSDDSFSIFEGGSVDIAGPMKVASSTTGAQDWTGIVW